MKQIDGQISITEYISTLDGRFPSCSGGKHGIHQKLVNRMGAVDGIEILGGMSGDIENYSLRLSDSGTCAFGNCPVWHV